MALNYRSGREKASATAQAITAAGGRAITIQGDVGDPAAATAMVERAVAELGGLHILVNNAGITRDGLFPNLDMDSWTEVMKVNFGGTFHCMRASVDYFMSNREGSIVNVSSVMAERGWVGNSLYAASKAAINALTRTAAVELARFQIRVNAVLPGFVPTEMVKELLSGDGERGVLRQIPMRVFARPEDVASVVVFLAGPDSRHMTGSLVTVDGGASSLLGIGSPLR